MTHHTPRLVLMLLLAGLLASGCSEDNRNDEQPDRQVNIAVTLPVKQGTLALYGLDGYTPMSSEHFPAQLDGIQKNLPQDIHFLGALAKTPTSDRPEQGDTALREYVTVVQPIKLEGIKISNKEFIRAKENLRVMSGVAGVEDIIGILQENTAQDSNAPLSVEQMQWLGPIGESETYICIGMLANYSPTAEKQENAPLTALALTMYHVDGFVFSVNNYQIIHSPEELRGFFTNMAKRAADMKPTLLMPGR